jgi:ABC-type antimicrobial peptide transport system permease subunit
MNNFKYLIENSIQLAYGALKRQRGRSILTMLAISIGIAAVITINAAGAGIQRFVLGQLDVFGADTLWIEPRVPSNRQGAGFGDVGITITTMKEKDVRDILKHPNVVTASGAVNGQEAVSYQGQIKKIMLMGRGASMPEVEKVEIIEGRFYTQDEEDSLATVVVLGFKAKEKLFGDSEAAEKTIYIGGKTFRVVGVLAERGSAFFMDMDNVVFVPTKTMQKRILGIDYYQGIQVRMRDGAKTKETVEDIQALMLENHNITDPEKRDFEVQSTADAQETLTTVTGGLTLLLIALVCISLIVGGVGIMNIMYVSVAERTFEIGLRKSLGATKKAVLWQFLAEAVLITLGGGIVGVVIGTLLAGLIYLIATSLGFKWVFSITASSVLLSVGFSAVIGFIFGLYPAKKAAELNPIEALRKE